MRFAVSAQNSTQRLKIEYVFFTVKKKNCRGSKLCMKVLIEGF